VISWATESADGPSACVQLAELVGGADGGLQPQPAVIRPIVVDIAVMVPSRMMRA
jgi:hypothetical protein